MQHPVRAAKALVGREIALVARDQCGEHPRCESELRAPMHWKGEDRSHVEGNAKPLPIRLVERRRGSKLNGIDGEALETGCGRPRRVAAALSGEAAKQRSILGVLRKKHRA